MNNIPLFPEYKETKTDRGIILQSRVRVEKPDGWYIQNATTEYICDPEAFDSMRERFIDRSEEWAKLCIPNLDLTDHEGNKVWEKE